MDRKTPSGLAERYAYSTNVVDMTDIDDAIVRTIGKVRVNLGLYIHTPFSVNSSCSLIINFHIIRYYGKED